MRRSAADDLEMGLGAPLKDEAADHLDDARWRPSV